MHSQPVGQSLDRSLLLTSKSGKMWYVIRRCVTLPQSLSLRPPGRTKGTKTRFHHEPSMRVSMTFGSNPVLIPPLGPF